ncbi:hypothetical protein L484_013351 [Morus notabilis]|uniref:Uncharacterized protein n=1 Tax=Morus notabilis TaxID=981085 RepID=W9RXU5_9ROSA|nr:hypothetical protein L484_013351 [Morus notabilis]
MTERLTLQRFGLGRASDGDLWKVRGRNWIVARVPKRQIFVHHRHNPGSLSSKPYSCARPQQAESHTTPPPS